MEWPQSYCRFPSSSNGEDLLSNANKPLVPFVWSTYLSDNVNNHFSTRTPSIRGPKRTTRATTREVDLQWRKLSGMLAAMFCPKKQRGGARRCFSHFARLTQQSAGWTTTRRDGDGRKKAQKAQNDSVFVLFVPLCGSRSCVLSCGLVSNSDKAFGVTPANTRTRTAASLTKTNYF